MMNLSSSDALRLVPVFAVLEEPLLTEIAERSRRRRYPANEAVFHEEDPGFTLYIILSGGVRIQRVAPSGEIIHLADRGPGDYIGELALIDGRPRMADAVTAEASELLMLDRSDFLTSVERSPRAALAIMACLAERLREAAGDVERLREHDVLGRLAAVLLDLAESHGEACAEGIRITLRFTQNDLAGRIGATRESVNRALRSLKDAGAIARGGQCIVVTSESRLRRYGD